MKLNKKQVDTIEKKTGFSPVPDDAATQSGLAGHFGENTFYLDSKGVYVFEAVEQPSEEGDHVMAVQIAEVEPAEGDAVTIRGIQPKATALTVDLAV